MMPRVRVGEVGNLVLVNCGIIQIWTTLFNLFNIYLEVEMISKRTYTPLSRESYSCGAENMPKLMRKQKKDAFSIKDRYTPKKALKTQTQTSLNEQQDLLFANGNNKNSITKSLLPKIDTKPSFYSTKIESYKENTPKISVKHLQFKKQGKDFLGLNSCEVKERSNCAYITHEGGRIKNEDRISIQEFQIDGRYYRFYAVFDGHGGHLAATYLASNSALLIKVSLSQGSNPCAAMKQTLFTIQQKFKKNPRLAHKSGSCALLCLIHQKQCWVANVGDSRMLSIDQNHQFLQITRDHKPEDQVQMRRIEYFGGEVSRHNRSQIDSEHDDSPYRVYPGSLSVSRTLGDIYLKKNHPNLVIAQPDIYHYTLQKTNYLLLFSDGLYEKFTNRQITQFFLSSKNKVAAIKQLYGEALSRKSTDNRSLIVVELK